MILERPNRPNYFEQAHMIFFWTNVYDLDLSESNLAKMINDLDPSGVKNKLNLSKTTCICPKCFGRSKINLQLCKEKEIGIKRTFHDKKSKYDG